MYFFCMFIELFEDMLLHPTLDSSVGRAEDCRGSNELQISLGHWFESGSREKLFYCDFIMLYFQLNLRKSPLLGNGSLLQWAPLFQVCSHSIKIFPDPSLTFTLTRPAFPVFGTTKTSVLSINLQSRFASIVLDSVFGPPHPAWHTQWCLCISCIWKQPTRSSQGPLKGTVCQLKKPFKGPRRR